MHAMETTIGRLGADLVKARHDIILSDKRHVAWMCVKQYEHQKLLRVCIVLFTICLYVLLCFVCSRGTMMRMCIKQFEHQKLLRVARQIYHVVAFLHGLWVHSLLALCAFGIALKPRGIGLLLS